jgi:hypothetical protein
MSILLINPLTLNVLPNKGYIPSSSLLSLAAILKHSGFSIKILDLNIYKPVKDNLFVDEVDTKNFWKMEGFHYHTNENFYIKPYYMEIDELNAFKDKFNELPSVNPHEKKARHE